MKNIIEKIKELNTYQIPKQNKLATVETYLLLFLTGSVIGWFYELFFYWIFENRISNNGFFYGPYIPIYGFGTLFIVLLTGKVRKYPFAIFFLSIPITGILEYVTGYVMYELWATRWWDYRGLFMNIDGFVCLRSVISFAVGAIFLVYLVEPLVCMVSGKMKERTRNLVCVAVLIIFLIDIIATVLFRMPDFV